MSQLSGHCQQPSGQNAKNPCMPVVGSTLQSGSPGALEAMGVFRGSKKKVWSMAATRPPVCPEVHREVHLPTWLALNRAYLKDGIGLHFLPEGTDGAGDKRGNEGLSPCTERSATSIASHGPILLIQYPRQRT